MPINTAVRFKRPAILGTGALPSRRVNLQDVKSRVMMTLFGLFSICGVVSGTANRSRGMDEGRLQKLGPITQHRPSGIPDTVQ